MIAQLCTIAAINQLLCDPLRYQFMQNALIGMLMLGIVTGCIGAYVVVRGMAFMTDALGHAILPGVAVAYLNGGVHGPLLLGAAVAGSITALVIGFFTRGGKLREDTAIGIVFTGALALGLMILSLHSATATDLETLLVGNILALSGSDLLAILVVGLAILLLIRIFYKELLIVSFDPVLAATLQYPVEGLRYLLLLMLAMTAVIAIQAVGVILIAAMMVTPAATAWLLVRRLNVMMIVGAAICCFCGVFGVMLSYYLSVNAGIDVSASAVVVVTMTLLFVLAYLFAPKRGLLWNALQTRQTVPSGG